MDHVLEISEVARGLRARCFYTLLTTEFWRERKPRAAFAEGHCDSRSTQNPLALGLSLQKNHASQGPSPLYVVFCEHSEQTAWPGVWPWYLCPGVTLTVLESKSSGFPHWLHLAHGLQGCWAVAGHQGEYKNVRHAAKKSPSRGLERTGRELSRPCTFSAINYCKWNSHSPEQGRKWALFSSLGCSEELFREPFSEESPRMALSAARLRGALCSQPFWLQRGAACYLDVQRRSLF